MCQMNRRPEWVQEWPHHHWKQHDKKTTTAKIIVIIMIENNIEHMRATRKVDMEIK